ncbi:molybdopterin-binding protein, partial [Sutterella wadsworthensis]
LEVLAQSFDFIITVGGTGQGKSDMLRLALKRAGAKQSEDQTKLSSSLPFVCANLKGAVLFGLPGNPLGFVNIVQRVVLPVIWQSFRTDPFFVRRQKVFMGFDYEGKAGDICVQLAPFEGRVIALPVQKGSGRSSAFRDAAAAIPNPQGRRIEAGEAVEAQLFFNGLLS